MGFVQISILVLNLEDNLLFAQGDVTNPPVSLKLIFRMEPQHNCGGSLLREMRNKTETEKNSTFNDGF